MMSGDASDKESCGVKRFFITICLLIALGITLGSCIGPARVRSTPDPTILELKKRDQLTQNIAVILSHAPQTPVGRNAGDRFFKTMLKAMRHENQKLDIISDQHEKFPDFIEAFGHHDAPLDVFAIADIARRKGYQAFLVARIISLYPESKDSGLFWWRKSRYYLTVAVSMDLYDPFTAAKIVSRVKKKTFQVTTNEYFDLWDDEAVNIKIKKLTSTLTKMAKSLGETAAEHMADQPWKTTVLHVDGPDVILADGGGSGFELQDRLDIYEGRRIIEGPNGQRYIVPGYKAGQIEITAMEGRFMRARTLGQFDISEGDLVVVAR
jgi:hypothetical protein